MPSLAGAAHQGIFRVKIFKNFIADSKKVTTFAIPIWDGGLVSSVGRAQHF